MPWLLWREVRKNAMAPKGSLDCTTWLEPVDEKWKMPLLGAHHCVAALKKDA